MTLASQSSAETSAVEVAPDEASSVEVTHEDFQRQASNKKRFRFRDLLPTNNKNSPSDAREILIASSELMSVTNLTVTSHETVRVSNRSEKETQQKSAGIQLPMKGWGLIRKKLKGKTAVKTQESTGSNSPVADGGAATSKKVPLLRRRVLGDRSLRDRSKVTLLRRMKMDDAMRGRMDGMDVLSLGPARLVSNRRSQVLDDCDSYVETMNTPLTPSKMVSDMILKSAGRDPPEMVLEGFMPGGDDRWRVSMEEPLVFPQEPVVIISPAPAETASTSDCGSSLSCPALAASECGSSLTCGEDDLTALMGTMWGLEKPPPTHATASPEPVDDDVFQMASACNVPIDVDEEAFMVETSQHLRSVHDIASIYLSRQDYEGALTIFFKILKGLKLKHEEKPHFVIGSTLHNIGIIQMWQGRFSEALITFDQAVAMRMDVLPSKHPDIAVSLVRKAFCEFALDRLADSADSFGKALALCPAKNATRAKILNNIGVVQYQSRLLIQALTAFAGALEIQRKLLEGPVRRESIIFDATTTLQNMGKFYVTKCDFGTGLDVFQEAMVVSTFKRFICFLRSHLTTYDRQLQQTAFRKDSPIVLENLGNLAYTKIKTGDLSKATEMYNCILKAQEVQNGKESREYNETLGLLGLILTLQQEHSEALSCLTAALKWQEENLGATHPSVQFTKGLVKKISRVSRRGSSEWT